MLGLWTNLETDELVEVVEIIPDGDPRTDAGFAQLVVKRADETLERWYPIPFRIAHRVVA